MRNTPPAPSMMNISVDDNTADAINKIRQLFKLPKHMKNHVHGIQVSDTYTQYCGVWNPSIPVPRTPL